MLNIMRNYFDLLLDLLEIEDKAPYQSLAQQIEEAPANADFLFAHRASFILNGYLDLLKGELAPEEFVLLGDVESAQPLWQKGQKSSEEVIKSLLNWEIPEQKILVLDLATWQIMLDQKQKDVFLQKLKENNKTLILG